jgi:hypothetical protein
MDLCIREFVDYGFNLSSGEDQSGGDVPQIMIDRKESEYSSIHIALEARGPSGYETDSSWSGRAVREQKVVCVAWRAASGPPGVWAFYRSVTRTTLPRSDVMVRVRPCWKGCA